MNIDEVVYEDLPDSIRPYLEEIDIVLGKLGKTPMDAARALDRAKKNLSFNGLEGFEHLEVGTEETFNFVEKAVIKTYEVLKKIITGLFSIIWKVISSIAKFFGNLFVKTKQAANSDSKEVKSTKEVAKKVKKIEPYDAGEFATLNKPESEGGVLDFNSTKPFCVADGVNATTRARFIKTIFDNKEPFLMPQWFNTGNDSSDLATYFLARQNAIDKAIMLWDAVITEQTAKIKGIAAAVANIQEYEKDPLAYRNGATSIDFELLNNRNCYDLLQGFKDYSGFVRSDWGEDTQLPETVVSCNFNKLNSLGDIELSVNLIRAPFRHITSTGEDDEEVNVTYCDSKARWKGNSSKPKHNVTPYFVFNGLDSAVPESGVKLLKMYFEKRQAKIRKDVDDLNKILKATEKDLKVLNKNIPPSNPPHLVSDKVMLQKILVGSASIFQQCIEFSARLVKEDQVLCTEIIEVIKHHKLLAKGGS